MFFDRYYASQYLKSGIPRAHTYWGEKAPRGLNLPKPYPKRHEYISPKSAHPPCSVIERRE